ncbi:MAG: helix-turn-helix domain-containing protein [Paracoccaceae bacterium]
MTESQGRATIPAIVAAAGVSTGSIYHRFGSREALLGEAWLDALLAFNGMFLSALDSDEAAAGVNAALATPRFARTEISRARILIACRQADFLCPDTPAAIREAITTANANAFRAIGAFARQWGTDIETAKLALIGIPLGAVKLYLPKNPVPESLDVAIEKAVTAVLGPKR